LPPVGTEVNTPTGKSKVVNINPLKETVFVELPSGAVVEMNLSEINQSGQKPPRNVKRRN
jgi:cell fate regulator YaaT (PSP1 superfamily)